MPRFRVTAAARADLKRIARFTERTWGREQRNHYLAKIDQAFHLLADNAESGKACDFIRSGYRVHPVGSHLIFFKPGVGETVQIIRVLHKRMEVSSRLLKA